MQDNKKLVINKNMLISILSITGILLTMILFLVSFKVVEWSWIVGFILGTATSISAIFLINFSVKSLVAFENPYFYYFLYVIRIGIYAVPFLISIYLSAYSSIFGVAIGFINLIAIPFISFKK